VPLILVIMMGINQNIVEDRPKPWSSQKGLEPPVVLKGPPQNLSSQHLHLVFIVLQVPIFIDRVIWRVVGELDRSCELRNESEALFVPLTVLSGERILTLGLHGVDEVVEEHHGGVIRGRHAAELFEEQRTHSVRLTEEVKLSLSPDEHPEQDWREDPPGSCFLLFLVEFAHQALFCSLDLIGVQVDVVDELSIPLSRLLYDEINVVSRELQSSLTGPFAQVEQVLDQVLELTGLHMILN